MPDEEEEKEQAEGGNYVEASDGFDHPNVNAMDDVFLVTMNNERLVNSYIQSKDVAIVKAEIRVMGAMEKLFAGGYYDVDSARAIQAGTFTLERGVDSAREGFKARMDHSQFNYEVMQGPKKSGGFLSSLNPFRRKEERVYSAEPGR